MASYNTKRVEKLENMIGHYPDEEKEEVSEYIIPSIAELPFIIRFILQILIILATTIFLVYLGGI